MLVLDESLRLVEAGVVTDTEVFSETFLSVSETFDSIFLDVEIVPVNAKYNKKTKNKKFLCNNSKR